MKRFLASWGVISASFDVIEHQIVDIARHACGNVDLWLCTGVFLSLHLQTERFVAYKHAQTSESSSSYTAVSLHSAMKQGQEIHKAITV